jgi:hypothetical protein
MGLVSAAACSCLALNNILYACDPAMFFRRGVKRPGREAAHSPQSSAEVKKSGAIPLLRDMSSLPGAKEIKHRDNFTFNFTFTVQLQKVAKRPFVGHEAFTTATVKSTVF